MSGHSVDRDLQAAITLSQENCVQKRECSVLLDFHGKLDERLRTVEVV